MSLSYASSKEHLFSCPPCHLIPLPSMRHTVLPANPHSFHFFTEPKGEGITIASTRSSCLLLASGRHPLSGLEHRLEKLGSNCHERSLEGALPRAPRIAARSRPKSSSAPGKISERRRLNEAAEESKALPMHFQWCGGALREARTAASRAFGVAGWRAMCRSSKVSAASLVSPPAISWL
jgi:hypothetical protein